MIKKNVAIALLIIALVLVSFCAYDYFLGEEKGSSIKINSLEGNSSSGNGKVGVTILSPTVEDKNNGS